MGEKKQRCQTRNFRKRSYFARANSIRFFKIKNYNLLKFTNNAKELHKWKQSLATESSGSEKMKEEDPGFATSLGKFLNNLNIFHF
jgi:hypothetical protein